MPPLINPTSPSFGSSAKPSETAVQRQTIVIILRPEGIVNHCLEIRAWRMQRYTIYVKKTMQRKVTLAHTGMHNDMAIIFARAKPNAPGRSNAVR